MIKNATYKMLMRGSSLVTIVAVHRHKKPAENRYAVYPFAKASGT